MNKSKVSAPAPAANKGKSPKVAWKDKLSEVDYESLKSVFDLFDSDNSGTIDPVEINQILEELHLKGRNRVVFEIVEALKDTNKLLTFDDFLDIVGPKAGDLKSREGVQRVFNLWDKEGTGSVNFDSFKSIAQELGETMNDDELIEMMHNAYILNGTNSHDDFSFEEFYAIVTKKAA